MTLLNSMRNFVFKMLFYFRSTCYRQWQKETAENAKQRCSIEHYKEHIADMSKQLGRVSLKAKCINDLRGLDYVHLFIFNDSIFH